MTRAGVLRAAGRVLAGAALTVVLAVGAAAVAVPRLAGAVPLTVLSSSMEPTLWPGDLAVVTPVAPEDVAVGDVVTYRLRPDDPALVTHRVVGMSVDTTGAARFVLQGDNNDAPDPGFVSGDQVRGRLWYSLPAVGHLTTLLPATAREAAVAASAAVLFGYAGVTAAAAVLARRERWRAASDQ